MKIAEDPGRFLDDSCARSTHEFLNETQRPAGLEQQNDHAAAQHDAVFMQCEYDHARREHVGDAIESLANPHHVENDEDAVHNTATKSILGPCSTRSPSSPRLLTNACRLEILSERSGAPPDQAT